MHVFTVQVLGTTPVYVQTPEVHLMALVPRLSLHHWHMSQHPCPVKVPLPLSLLFVWP